MYPTLVGMDNINTERKVERWLLALQHKANNRVRIGEEMTDQSIFSDITAWLARNFPNDLRSNWYVGIARNIEDRLFGDHGVHRTNDVWIYRQAIDAGHARSAEAGLIQNGYDGGSGGGDNQSTFVYAFRKTANTVR